MEAWDNYFSKIDESKKEILLKILSKSMKISPQAIAAMPYGVPGLKLNGKNLIAVAAHKEHFGVYPFSPKVIDGVQPQLGDLETAQGTIRFSYNDFPSDYLLEKLIELRSAEIS